MTPGEKEKKKIHASETLEKSLNWTLFSELRRIIPEQYFPPGYLQLLNLFCFAGEMHLFQMAAPNVIFHAGSTNRNYWHFSSQQRRWKLSVSLQDVLSHH